MASTSKAFVTVLLLSLALYQVTAAEPSLKDDSLAKKIVGAIKELTILSSNLRLAANQITLVNVNLYGPRIPQGFAEIATKVSEANNAISGATTNAHASYSFSDDDAKLVVETLTTFVKVHQQLLSTVIGKYGLFSFSPFVEPIRLTLEKLEIEVDSFALSLVDLIPTQEEAATAQFESLSVSIKAAIQAYTPSLSHRDSRVESIQAAFKEVTKLSDDLRLQTLKINFATAPLAGYQLPLGISGIVQKVNQVIAQLAGVNGGLSALSDDDAKLVVKSLKTFVQVHDAMLYAVIDKYAIITLVPFFEPIRLSLESLKGTLDTFALHLTGLIPTQKAAADNEFEFLGVNLKLAIELYSTPYSIPFTAYV